MRLRLSLLSSVTFLVLACGAEDPPPPGGVGTGVGAGPATGVAGAGVPGAGGAAGGGAAGPVGTTADGDQIIAGDPTDTGSGGGTTAVSGPAPPGCGDTLLTADEACDDGNLLDGDGCSANCLAVESGFSCAQPGAACLPIALCGDGLVAMSEQCDDGNRTPGDGCSDSCKFEIGFNCSYEPSVCVTEVCGDGVQRGAESCDDGNVVPFDGCSDRCVKEPSCVPGDPNGCTSACGDGLVIGEECDDGNQVSGDGCSATCTIENGFMCEQIIPPCEEVNNECVLRVPVIYRDHSESHPDFGVNSAECTRVVEESGEEVPGNVLTEGLVQDTVGPTGRPQLAGATGQQECDPDSNKDSYTGITQFDDWFTDGPNVVTVPSSLVLFDNDDGGFVNRFGEDGEQFEGLDNEVYADGGDYLCSWCLDGDCEDPCDADEESYDGSPLFFPVDDVTGPTADLGPAKVPSEYGYTGWPWEEDLLGNADDHNFYFTTEVQTWFEFTADMDATLEFTGDDDVWVFVNGILAVDLGGIHAPVDGDVTISSRTAATYGLTVGGVYNITVFQAERRMEGSSFRLTLSGFENSPSDCHADCGDGIVAFGEECDDGVNDGGYGECGANCRLGEFCGDGIVNGAEHCDTGPVGLEGCIGCRRLVAR